MLFLEPDSLCMQLTQRYTFSRQTEDMFQIILAALSWQGVLYVYPPTPGDFPVQGYFVAIDFKQVEIQSTGIIHSCL